MRHVEFCFEAGSLGALAPSGRAEYEADHLSARLPTLGQRYRPTPLPPPPGLVVQQLVDSRMRARRLAGLTQREPSSSDLDIDVSFRPARQLFKHLVTADRFGDRRVHGVVPAPCPLGLGHLVATLPAQEVPVAAAVVEDLVVAAEPAALEPRLGPPAM